jgi:DNA invertase Pin-like site-specific DNA recombinase
MKVARIYLRVSTDNQDLARQARIEAVAIAEGYYIAGVYREKASGARADRPELQRMIADLRPGDVVIAKDMDRITRLPLPEAEALIQRIEASGARLAVPGLIDLSEVVSGAEGVSRIVLEAMQGMLLRIVLYQARNNYETMRRRQREGIDLAKADGKYKGGRKADKTMHARIVAFREAKHSIADTARLAGCSEPLVKLVWREHKAKKAAAPAPAP